MIILRSTCSNQRWRKGEKGAGGASNRGGEGDGRRTPTHAEVYRQSSVNVPGSGTVEIGRGAPDASDRDGEDSGRGTSFGSDKHGQFGNNIYESRMIEGDEETLAPLHPFHVLKRVPFPIDSIDTRVPSFHPHF
jgi:hypothetical protein